MRTFEHCGKGFLRVDATPAGKDRVLNAK